MSRINTYSTYMYATYHRVVKFWEITNEKQVKMALVKEEKIL